tara:strand:- start:128 stop:532 length:405 start_codon:yes stop_codon:yes gene_type:complete
MGARCLDGSPGAFYFAPSTAATEARAQAKRDTWTKGSSSSSSNAATGAVEQSTEAVEDQANDWIVYMRHGGWCTSVEGCLSRSHVCLGTTAGLTETSVSPGAEVQCGDARPRGVLSDDCELNPAWCHANVVYMW